MPKYTPQQIFDTVARHLHQQRGRSVDGVQCLYRGPGDLKCAVGCLIPDELYTPDMEGHPIIILLGRNKDLRNLFGTGVMLLSSLQTTHDAVNNWNTDNRFARPNELRVIAHTYKLNPVVIDELWSTT